MKRMENEMSMQETEQKKYRIVSDGDCDLPVEMVKELGIDVVPFYVSFDDTNYYRENIDIGIREFYDRMVNEPTVFPKSSMPSIQDYMDVFEPIVERGEAVICICITMKFSGSFQSATQAKQMILEEHPDAEITIIDSTLDTVCQGIYVLEAVKMWEKGISYEECVKRLYAMRGSGRIFFTVGNIEYLKHGGRIGKLSGLAGTVLGIKPLITLKEGEIFPSGITRSRTKSMQKVIDMLLEYLHGECQNEWEKYSLCIGYGYDIEESKTFRDMALERLHKEGILVENIKTFQIGATIGVHTGPYPLGFGIVKKWEYA